MVGGWREPNDVTKSFRDSFCLWPPGWLRQPALRTNKQASAHHMHHSMAMRPNQELLDACTHAAVYGKVGTIEVASLRHAHTCTRHAHTSDGKVLDGPKAYG
jgi:hypothetical protein